MLTPLSPVAVLALCFAIGTASASASARDGVHPKLVGEGPMGADNGAVNACTGVQAMLPAVICVRAGAPGGGTGTVALPFASINAAIAAATAGDIVQVAGGTYAENVALGSFVVPSSKHLTLLGGFASDFASRAAAVNRSIVDGGTLNPAVQLHVDSNQTTTLDGFELIGGVGLGSDFSDGGGGGGGVHANQYNDGTMVISHNRIHQNQTRNYTTDDTRGGGIHAETQNFDGALATVRIEDNHVYENLAGKGAGINVAGRQATLLRNRVQDNTAHNDHGGGIYVSTVGTEVRDNIIRGNRVGATVGYGWGGGILIAGAGADLTGNLIAFNTTPSAGSGVFWDEGAVGTMRNDLVVKNVCPSIAGAAIYVDGGPGGPSNVLLENVTIADHPCPGIGGAVYIEDGSQIAIRNAILWNNTQEFSTITGGGFSISYSITQASGTGNIVGDPLFADPLALDYHERSTAGRFTPGGFVNDAMSSPALDAGDPASSYVQETQPNGGRVNLGAFGNTPEASRSPNGDGDAIFGDGFES
jgi:parallel beta-helix repeat protein